MIKREILVAEDSLTQLEQLKYILESNDYIVHTARDGQSALEMLKDRKPGLIISDIVMPLMDGYTLCRKIKSDNELKHIPVMLLTNLSDPQDVIKGLQAGADNFLTKPYNEDFLLSRVNYIMINQEVRLHSMASNMGIEIVFGGEKYFINSDRMQIIDLLLSTYENAIQKNNELTEANRKLMEMHHELAQKNRELEKANEQKNKFLRMAAHDIRNPIGSALAFSSFLEEEAGSKLSQTQLEYLGYIKESNEFVLQLLNELLDIAVIESGKLQLNKSRVDLSALIKRNISVNKIIADKKSITIKVSSCEQSFKLDIDCTKIEQVLNNLISNAIKFSFPESIIEVKICKIGSEAIVAVIDNGQGIPQTELDNLFKPFARTSVQSTAGERSTGLGLSIVKKIVEAHEGKVWVESQVSKGSAFYFSLPLVPERN
ncbi:MAG: ATP-binding protein [Bacillota bacterium]